MALAKHPLFHPPIVRRALWEALYKLAPRHMVRNPVMFVVFVGSALTTLVFVHDVVAHRGHLAFTLELAVWLWFTVLFANFAEAMAEGRGKAQADALRANRQETRAGRLLNLRDHLDFESVFAAELRVGDSVLVKAGDLIPADADAVEGIASVDEAPVPGESAPVIREAGGDRSRPSPEVRGCSPTGWSSASRRTLGTASSTGSSPWWREHRAGGRPTKSPSPSCSPGSPSSCSS